MSKRGPRVVNDFYCIVCGNKGIPIPRRKSRDHGPEHRKALYCCHCRMTLNHIEIRTEAEAERFRRDFEAGRYKKEAEETIAYAKRKETEHENL